MTGFAIKAYLYKRPRWWLRLLGSWFSVYYGILNRLGSSMGVSQKKEPLLIVSLTTFSARFPIVHLCLETLMRQSLKPDKILLYIASAECHLVPERLLNMRRRGLEICYVDDDLRSHNKYYHARKDYPWAVLVTADDDLFYPRHWLRALWHSYLRQPDYIHCHRAHAMRFGADGYPLPYREWDYESPGISGPSLDLFPAGTAGVLYPPGYLPEGVLRKDELLTLAPKADDVWLRLWTRRFKIPVKKVHPYYKKLVEIPQSQVRALHRENWGLDQNNVQIAAVTRYLDSVIDGTS